MKAGSDSNLVCSEVGWVAEGRGNFSEMSIVRRVVDRGDLRNPINFSLVDGYICLWEDS